MGTISDKLIHLSGCKARLRVALEEAGADIGDKPLAQWPQAVSSLTPGGAGHNLAFGPDAPAGDAVWLSCLEPERVELTPDPIPGPAWGDAPAMSIHAAQCGVAVFGGKIYSFGGDANNIYEGTGWGAVDHIWVFDPETGHAIHPTRLPEPIYRPGCAVAGDKIWLLGGRDYDHEPMAQIWVFDPATGEISDTGACLPSPRYAPAAAVGTTVYLLGGADGSTDYDEILALDTQTLTIRTLDARLPHKCWGASAAAVGGKVYVFGGIGYPNSTETTRDTVACLDPVTETVTQLPCRLAIPRLQATAVAVGEKIWVLGGFTWTTGSANHIDRDIVEVLDPQAQSLTPGPSLPQISWGQIAGLLGQTLYAFGGSTRTSTFKDGYALALGGWEPGLLRLGIGPEGPRYPLIKGGTALTAAITAGEIADANGLWSPVTVRTVDS